MATRSCIVYPVPTEEAQTYDLTQYSVVEGLEISQPSPHNGSVSKFVICRNEDEARHIASRLAAKYPGCEFAWAQAEEHFFVPKTNSVRKVWTNEGELR